MTKALHARILDFCARHSMLWSRFGYWTARKHSFVTELPHVTRIMQRTHDRTVYFMDLVDGGKDPETASQEAYRTYPSVRAMRRVQGTTSKGHHAPAPEGGLEEIIDMQDAIWRRVDAREAERAARNRALLAAEIAARPKTSRRCTVPSGFAD
jgi:hypothetical protein